MRDNVKIAVDIEYETLEKITKFNKKNKINNTNFNYLPFKEFDIVLITKLDEDDCKNLKGLMKNIEDLPKHKKEKILKLYKEKMIQVKEERLVLGISIKDTVLNIKYEGVSEIEVKFKSESVDLSSDINKNTSYLKSAILNNTLEKLVKTSMEEKVKYENFLYSTVVHVLQVLAYMSCDTKIDIPKERLISKQSEKIIKSNKKKKSKGSKNKVSIIKNIRYVIDKEEVNKNTEEYIKRQYTRQTDMWFTKGFWRTYKSGKKVWVKPCVKKSRKKDTLKDNDILEKKYKII